MAVVDISEYRTMARDGQNAVIQTGIEPSTVNQQVAITAGSVQSAAFFDTATRFIRVHADAPCRIEIGVNPTAAATSKRMAAGASEYFGLPGGTPFKIAVITTT